MAGTSSFSVNQGDTGRKLSQYFAALAANGGSLAAGTILGWTSPTEDQIVDKSSITNVTFSPAYDFEVSAEQFSWVGALATLGAAFICIPIGFLANWFGRKWTMIGLVIPFTVGWVLVIWAQNLTMLFIGRFFLGIAGGAFCVTGPMYVGEISQKEIRGTLGSFFQLMVTIGIVFAYAVGAIVHVFYLSIICGVIPLLFGLVFFFMPESPTYLVFKGRNKDALKSLEWLRGSHYDGSDEVAELENERNALEANSTNLRQALMRTESLRSAFIAIGLVFFLQMSGVNVVIFYTAGIFTDSGTSIDAKISTIIVGSIQAFSTFISSLVVDKSGRRLLLLLSVGLMGICLCGLGVFFYLKDEGSESIDSLEWLPITSLCIFMVAFSLGFGPVPWLMAGEIFAPDIKGLLVAVAGTTSWLLAFVITKFFTNLKDAIGNGPTFWLFMGFCVIGFIFVTLFVPETKGKSFQQIQNQIKHQCIQITDYKED